MVKKGKREQTSSHTGLFLASLACMVSTFEIGCIMAFPVISMECYKSPTCTPLSLPLTNDEASWFASIVFITCTAGNLASGLLCEIYGRKTTLIMGNTLILATWISLDYSSTFAGLFLSRALMGTGAGIALAASFVLLGEISTVNSRGALGTINSSIRNFGILYSLIIGASFDFGHYTLACGLPCILFFLGCWLVPESPLWLVKVQKQQEAREALQYLRGRCRDVSSELEEMISLLEDDNNNTDGLIVSMHKAMSRRVVYPLALLSLLFLLQGCSGADTMHIYSLEIFQEAGIVIDKYVLAILIQAAFTVCNFLSAFLMTVSQRRTQFISSGLVMACSLLAVAYTLQQGIEMPHLVKQCQPLFFLAIAFAYSCGYGTVTYSLGAELFPSEVKGVCTAMALAVMDISVFLALKTFPATVDRLHLSGAFAMNGLIVMIGVTLAWMFLPETKDKSLTELNLLLCENMDKAKYMVLK